MPPLLWRRKLHVCIPPVKRLLGVFVGGTIVESGSRTTGCRSVVEAIDAVPSQGFNDPAVREGEAVKPDTHAVLPIGSGCASCWAAVG